MIAHGIIQLTSVEAMVAEQGSEYQGMFPFSLVLDTVIV